MHRYTFRFVTTCLVLGAAAIGGYLSGLGAPSRHLVPKWENLPVEVGQWQGRQLPVDSQVVQYLEAEKMVRMAYRKENVLVVFSAIFGTRWRSLHSPAGCFSSQGWHTLQRREIEVEAAPGNPHPGPLHAEQLLVKRENEHRLVTYLYAYPGGTTASWVEQCLKVTRGGWRSGGIVVTLEGWCTPESFEVMDRSQRELLQALYPEVVRTWYSG